MEHTNGAWRAAEGEYGTFLYGEPARGRPTHWLTD